MNFTNDLQQSYRAPHRGSPADAIRVAHRLGAVWYAGRDRVLPPEPTLAETPWCQFAVVPASRTDGVEDRLVVCDAELARHGLGWVVNASENRDNVFLRVARALRLIDRVEATYGADTAVFLTGVLRDPLSNPRFEPRHVFVEDHALRGHVLQGVLEALSLR